MLPGPDGEHLRERDEYQCLSHDQRGNRLSSCSSTGHRTGSKYSMGSAPQHHQDRQHRSRSPTPDARGEVVPPYGIHSSIHRGFSGMGRQEQMYQDFDSRRTGSAGRFPLTARRCSLYCYWEILTHHQRQNHPDPPCSIHGFDSGCGISCRSFISRRRNSFDILPDHNGAHVRDSGHNPGAVSGRNAVYNLSISQRLSPRKLQ